MGTSGVVPHATGLWGVETRGDLGTLDSDPTPGVSSAEAGHPALGSTVLGRAEQMEARAPAAGLELSHTHPDPVKKRGLCGRCLTLESASSG